MQYRRNEEEFDLIDEIDKKKSKREQGKKRKASGDGLNFDDLEDEEKQLKLPTLAVKNNNKNQKQPSKSNYQKAGLADITAKNVQDVSKRKNGKKDSLQEELYEEADREMHRDSAKPHNKVQKKDKSEGPAQEEEYAYGHEQFQEEKYQEDFEQHYEEKIRSVKTEKKNEEPKKVTANKPSQPSQPSKQIKRQTASLAKKRESADRVQSRNSDHSINRSANSRPKLQIKKEDPPNKYSSIAEKACPNYDRSSLQDFSIDKITRDNDKMRGMIKKFNDELNEMINRNILQLKSKKEGKVVVTEDVLKILEEHKNNNQVALQNTIKDLERLKGKEGELRGEEFQLGLEQKIAETKSSIAEHGKLIIRLNNEVNNEGNKLSKFDKESVYTNEINTIKNGLALAKKDQIANEELSLKLDIKFQDLNQKIVDVDSRYAKILEECKASGFSISNTTQLNKKAEEVKKKLQIARVHKVKTESLFKTKGEMTAHELEQLRTQIKTIETQIETCEFSCDQVQNENKKSVEKAKKGNKLSAELITYLQNIITELQNAPNNREIKDEPSSFTQPKNTKKYQSQKNVEKVSIQPKEEKAQDDLNFKKPLLFKKKEKEEERPEERVWLEQKVEPKKTDKVKDNDLSKFEDKDKDNEKKEEEKKKPFVIKKNKDVKPQTPDLVDKAQKQTPKEAKKQVENKQEQIKIAPRMMKFKRNKQEETAEPQKGPQTAAIKHEQPVVNNPNSQNVQLVKQEQEQKAIFAPKRFNIKPKDRKNQEPAGYVASVVETKKEQPAKQQQFKPKGLTLEKQDSTPINNQIKTSIQEQKPKFNLRLKDRQRQSNKIQEEAPKFTINLNDKVQVPPSKQNNNPYANQFSGQQTNKARQGPLKKAKPAATIPKQQGSIYDQVEDMTNIQSAIAAQPKVTHVSSEQPDLHKLLGINKNTKPIDNDLIVDSKLVGKSKKQAKKDTNFFAELEI